jgi:hypothetical protein
MLVQVGSSLLLQLVGGCQQKQLTAAALERRALSLVGLCTKKAQQQQLP